MLFKLEQLYGLCRYKKKTLNVELFQNNNKLIPTCLAVYVVQILTKK